MSLMFRSAFYFLKYYYYIKYIFFTVIILMNSIDTYHVFQLIVYFTKFSFVFVLMILSKINHETQYIQEHPTYLIEDAIVCGFTSVLSACVVEYFRLNSIHAEGLILIFAFFFMYSVLREFSGFFVVTQKKKNKNSSNI